MSGLFFSAYICALTDPENSYICRDLHPVSVTRASASLLAVSGPEPCRLSLTGLCACVCMESLCLHCLHVSVSRATSLSRGSPE